MPTRSQRGVRLGEQVPRIRHAPSVRANDWEDCADLARAYGLELDPWQENVLQAALGIRSGGRWAASTVGVNVARQNGKGAIIEARELAGLLLFGEKTIIHSAHEMKTARVGFERILAYFENYDDLRKKVKSVTKAIARENIKLRSGAELHFPARSKGGIRGFSIDCLILDEAQILGDSAWEAIKPTISARPNTQTWLLGTTPTPLDDSAVFTRNRERAIKGSDQRLAWCEWSAPWGSDLDDPDVWAQANPALGVRISHEAVEDERSEMSDDGFARERLSMWAPGEMSQVLPNWPDLAVPPPSDPRRIKALAVAADVDVTRLTLGSAVESEGLHLAIELRSANTDRAAFCAEVARIQDLHDCPVGIDKGGPAEVLIPELLEARVRLTEISRDDFIQACSDLVSAVEVESVEHGDNSDLNTAVDAAGWRPLGDRRVFARRKGDISALEAVTIAHYVATNSPNYDVLDSIY